MLRYLARALPATLIAALCLPASAQTVWQVDVNGANGPTEAGWAGLTVIDPSEGDNLTLSGVNFSVISSDRSVRLQDHVPKKLQNIK